MKKVSFAITLFCSLLYFPSCYYCSGDQAQLVRLRDDSIRNALERKYTESELVQLGNELINLRLKLQNTRVNLATEQDKLTRLQPLQTIPASDGSLTLRRQSLTVKALEDNIALIERHIRDREHALQAHRSDVSQNY